MLLTLPLDTASSVSSSLVVIFWSLRTSSSVSCSNACLWRARKTHVTELGLVLLRIRNSWNPTNTAFIDRIHRVNIILAACDISSLLPSLLRKIIIIKKKTACCLKRTSSHHTILKIPCARARKRTVQLPCKSKWHLPNEPQSNCRYFLLIVTEV